MLERAVMLVLALIALGGCSMAPVYRQPEVDLPGTWAAPSGDAAWSTDTRWWTLYGDAQLDQLIAEALQYNADLALAVARVDEARAQLGVARAAQLPSVDATFKRGRQQSSTHGTMPLPENAPRENNEYQAHLNVSYEVDLWGRLHAGSAAARAQLLASAAARDTVRIALASQVVQTYFALRALDEQIDATRRSLTTRGEWLQLQHKRMEEGVISEFDYRQLEADVAAAQAQLPALTHERARQESALIILLGRSPKQVYEDRIVPNASAGGEPGVLMVPPGLPAELLLRRPDLVEAEQRLIAANARIGEVRAAMFPALTLTGMLGSESTTLRHLFNGPAGVWSLAAALAQPIFAGGRLQAGIETMEARERQALTQYHQAIRNAFREVRDAIHAQERMRERYAAESQRVTALNQSLRLAKLRYENGVASQLDVLDAERNLLQAEQRRADALRAQRAAVADLFKALGGGWPPAHH